MLASGELIDTDSDQYFEVNAPIEAMQAVIEQDEAPAPKAIEHEKSEGYEEFYQKHLREDSKVACVPKIAQATNKTEAQIINSAISNEARFLTAFEKWQASESEKKVKPQKLPAEELMVAAKKYNIIKK